MRRGALLRFIGPLQKTGRPFRQHPIKMCHCCCDVTSYPELDAMVYLVKKKNIFEFNCFVLFNNFQTCIKLHKEIKLDFTLVLNQIIQ